MATGSPWTKFYFADWRSDPRLRLCSLAARGLWIEMLAIMDEAAPRGHLLVEGHALTDTQLAVLASASPEEVPDLIADLEQWEVFSRNATGVIFSRRMVRDEKKAKTARRNGKMGGNPSLGKQTGIPPSDNPPDKPPDKGGVKAQKPEARGQKLERKGDPPLPPDGESGDGKAEPVHTGDAEQMVAAWNKLATEVGLTRVQKLTKQRRVKALARLRDCGGMAGWDAALVKIRGSPGLLGGNDRGWKADFDFVLRESSFTKLMEGKYDDWKGSGGSQRPTDTERRRRISSGYVRPTGLPEGTP